MAGKRYSEYDYEDEILDDGPAEPAAKRRQRRKKARIRTLWRLIVLVLVCVLLFTLWQNWETLAPDKLFAKLQDSLNGSTGSYPVDVAGTHVKRLTLSGNYTVTLSDSYLTYLDSGGGEVVRYPCTYSSALLRAAGRYVLLAEQTGRRVQLNTRSAIQTQIDAPLNILSVAVNERGQFAVLTQGPQGYMVQVTVYSRKGEVLYTRSRNQQATEVALSADGKQVALLSVQAVNGTLHSTVDVFSLTSTEQEAMCTYTAKDTLLYRLEYLGDGWLAAIGENGVVMLDTADGLATVYAPTGMRLLGYAAGEDDLALAMRPYGATGDGQVQIIDKNGEPRCTVDFTGEFRQLSGNGRQYLLLTDGMAQEITDAGAGRATAVEADGQQAVLSADSAVVLGLNVLQAYPLKTGNDID